MSLYQNINAWSHRVSYCGDDVYGQSLVIEVRNLVGLSKWVEFQRRVPTFHNLFRPFVKALGGPGASIPSVRLGTYPVPDLTAHQFIDRFVQTLADDVPLGLEGRLLIKIPAAITTFPSENSPASDVIRI